MAELELPSASKVENHGATEDGRLRAEEWNALVTAVGFLINREGSNEDYEQRISKLEQQMLGVDSILEAILFN